LLTVLGLLRLTAAGAIGFGLPAAVVGELRAAADAFGVDLLENAERRK
jgi:hypothetical protein